MKPQSDSSDPGFDADDEFAAPAAETPWRVAADGPQDPFGQAPSAAGPEAAADIEPPMSLASDQPGAYAATGSPVHDLIAEAEAAFGEPDDSLSSSAESRWGAEVRTDDAYAAMDGRTSGARSAFDETDFDEADDEFLTPVESPWRAESDRMESPFDPLPSVDEPAAAADAAPLLPPAADEPAPHAEAGGPVHDLLAGADASIGEMALPRITIHIFCTAPETAELTEKAAADRRMARAAVVVKMGGLAAAVETYQNQPTPSLVMVESRDSAAALLGQLDQLAEVCDPGTKVVVLGAANDIALYRELMRRGVSDYLVAPLNPLQVVRAVTTLYADPSAPFVGRQIAFCGAKGGAGSSTIAHNVAHSITERLQTGAVLVDLDLPFGTAGLDFNQDPLQGVADALSQPDRLDPVLMDRMMARCGERLALFAAPATLDVDYDIGADAYEEVTQKIRSVAPFVVLDLPHVWTAWKRKILLSSDDLVIVATPDLASLRNAKNMVDLVRRARPNDAPPRLVLNQVGVPGRPEIPVKDFGEALGLTPALALPFDPKLFGQAANNGQMLSEVGPKSRATEGIDHLAQQIARRDPPTIQKTSLFSGLFKRK